VTKLPADRINSAILDMLPLLLLALWSVVPVLGFYHSARLSPDIQLDLVPVIVDAGPDTVSLISGDTLILSCIVRAYPPPTAKIIKLSEDSFNSVDDEHDIDLDFDITSNDAEDTLIEVTLTQRAGVQDSGWYRCKATNPHGEAHEDYYVEVFENADKFYGTGEISIIDDVIDADGDDVTTGLTGGTTETITTVPLTTETEATEAISSDPTTPYYMKYF